MQFCMQLSTECSKFRFRNVTAVQKCESTANSSIAMIFSESFHINDMKNMDSKLFGISPCALLRLDHSSKLTRNFAYIHTDVLFGMFLINLIFRTVITLCAVNMSCI